MGNQLIKHKQNMRTLSLVICTLTYLICGAAIFDYLESPHEKKRWEFLSDMKRLVIEKYHISAEDYRMLEVVIPENKPNKAGPQWKFFGSFYFATVVLAVIGYGHSTPVTVGGKAFCMAYAMVGIPLGLVMFQSIGERLNKFISVVIKRIKRIVGCKKTEATQLDSMCATGLLSTIIITTGAALFSKYEGWNYFDSFYYCFVTLTTIGFGDYVALQNDHALEQKRGYVLMSLIFILFGLAVVAASINLLVLRFMTMEIEDNKRDENDEELQKNIIVDEDVALTLNGNLLADRLISAGNDDSDQISVCSCTCLDLKSNHKNRTDVLLPMETLSKPTPYYSSPRDSWCLETLEL